MKKLLILLLLIFALVAFTACGGKNKNPEPDIEDTPVTDNGTDNTDETPEEEKPVAKKQYTDFTTGENALINGYFGFVIPFCPTDEYYVADMSSSTKTERSTLIRYYTVGNSVSELEAYRALFTGYTLTNTGESTDGTVYTYDKDGVTVSLSYYLCEGNYLLDVYVSSVTEVVYTYTDFTDEEKALFDSYFGFVIPFVKNNEYYVEEYTADGNYGFEEGIRFRAYDTVIERISEYRAFFSSYIFVEYFLDESGNTRYTYMNDGYYVDMAYYTSESGTYLIDVYVYEITVGGNPGISGVLTNNGVGLPDESDGVYDVDFSKLPVINDVSDLTYYTNGCPSVGSPAVLVIPVQFSDCLASSKGYTVDALVNAFTKDGKNDYYSVYDYYYISSYGQLSLDITVLDEWFTPKYTSVYYEKATQNYYGERVGIGDQIIMNEALSYLSTFMDLSKFDSDNNGTIDSIVLINTVEIGSSNFHWAYSAKNIYTNNYGYYYTYDGVYANCYAWASYQFLFEEHDGKYKTFTDTSARNTYTFIHEFGHIIGSDDYYDYENIYDPLNSLDIMDITKGDHNPYTKFHYGWIDTSRLVVTDGSITLDLKAFEKTGDTIILATNWNKKLGAYQEYYVIMYYTDTGLNGENAGYFSESGIVVYHVNAALDREYDDNGVAYYFTHNNNNYVSGSDVHLIEFVKSSSNTYVYTEGDTLPTVTDDNGNTLEYTFTVNEINEDYATITFTYLA